MNQLLGRAIDAHGGMDRWRSFEKVEATIVTGGGFFALKGMMQDADPRRMTVWLTRNARRSCPTGPRTNELAAAMAKAESCGTGAYIEVVTDKYVAPAMAMKMHQSAKTLYKS